MKSDFVLETVEHLHMQHCAHIGSNTHVMNTAEHIFSNAVKSLYFTEHVANKCSF